MKSPPAALLCFVHLPLRDIPIHDQSRPRIHLFESFLKYELFTAVACTMSKTVSPTPRKRSAIERMEGSGIDEVSGLFQNSFSINEENAGGTHIERAGSTDVNPLDRRTPATTVESRTASTA
jgi:hypothetical protein